MTGWVFFGGLRPVLNAGMDSSSQASSLVVLNDGSAPEARGMDRALLNGALIASQHLRVHIALGVRTVEARILRHPAKRVFRADELHLVVLAQGQSEDFNSLSSHDEQH